MVYYLYNESTDTDQMLNDIGLYIPAQEYITIDSNDINGWMLDSSELYNAISNGNQGSGTGDRGLTLYNGDPGSGGTPYTVDEALRRLSLSKEADLVVFDNSTANLAGDPDTVQAAIDRLDQRIDDLSGTNWKKHVSARVLEIDNSPPSSPSEGDMWVDTTNSPDELKKYTSGSWVTTKTCADGERVIKLDDVSGTYYERIFVYDGIAETWTPVGDNEDNDTVIVDDDGDGKAAMYNFDTSSNSGHGSWIKIADIDWGSPTLQSVYDANSNNVLMSSTAGDVIWNLYTNGMWGVTDSMMNYFHITRPTSSSLSIDATLTNVDIVGDSASGHFNISSYDINFDAANEVVWKSSGADYALEQVGLRVKNYTTSGLPASANFGAIAFDVNKDSLVVWVTDSDGSGTDGWKEVALGSGTTTLDDAYNNAGGTPASPVVSNIIVDAGDVNWKLTPSSTYTPSKFYISDSSNNNIFSVLQNDTNSTSGISLQTKSDASVTSTGIHILDEGSVAGQAAAGIEIKSTIGTGSQAGNILMEGGVIQGTAERSLLLYATNLLARLESTSGDVEINAGSSITLNSGNSTSDDIVFNAARDISSTIGRAWNVTAGGTTSGTQSTWSFAGDWSVTVNYGLGGGVFSLSAGDSINLSADGTDMSLIANDSITLTTSNDAISILAATNLEFTAHSNLIHWYGTSDMLWSPQQIGLRLANYSTSSLPDSATMSTSYGAISFDTTKDRPVVWVTDSDGSGTDGWVALSTQSETQNIDLNKAYENGAGTPGSPNGQTITMDSGDVIWRLKPNTGAYQQSNFSIIEDLNLSSVFEVSSIYDSNSYSQNIITMHGFNGNGPFNSDLIYILAEAKNGTTTTGGIKIETASTGGTIDGITLSTIGGTDAGDIKFNSSNQITFSDSEVKAASSTTAIPFAVTTTIDYGSGTSAGALIDDFRTRFTDEAIINAIMETWDHAGSAYTFTNGLTETSGTVVLGGTFDDQNIDITSTSNKSFTVKSDDLTDANTSLSVTGSVIEMKVNSVSNSGDNIFRVNNSQILATSTQSGFAGIQYGANYSSNYTNRSLVDKEYVDGAISSSNNFTKARLFSAGNIDITSAPSSIDGVVPSSGDLIVALNQSNTAEDGVYVYNSPGSAMTRATNWEAGKHTAARIIIVEEGNVYADAEVLITNNSNNDVIGTDDLTYEITNRQTLDQVYDNETNARNIYVDNGDINWYIDSSLGSSRNFAISDRDGLSGFNVKENPDGSNNKSDLEINLISHNYNNSSPNGITIKDSADSSGVTGGGVTISTRAVGGGTAGNITIDSWNEIKLVATNDITIGTGGIINFEDDGGSAFESQVYGFRLRNLSSNPNLTNSNFGSLIFNTATDKPYVYVADDGSGNPGWVDLLTSATLAPVTLDQAYENGAGTPSSPSNQIITIDSGDVSWYLDSSGGITQSFGISDRAGLAALWIREYDDGGNRKEVRVELASHNWTSTSPHGLVIQDTAESSQNGGGIRIETVSYSTGSPGDITVNSGGDLELLGNSLLRLISGNNLVIGSGASGTTIEFQGDGTTFQSELDGVRLRNYSTNPTLSGSFYGSLVFNTTNDKPYVYVADDGSGNPGWVDLLTSATLAPVTLDQAYENGAGTPSSPTDQTITIDSGSIHWELSGSATFTEPLFDIRDGSGRQMFWMRTQHNSSTGVLEEEGAAIYVYSNVASPTRDLTLATRGDGSGNVAGEINIFSEGVNGGTGGNIAISADDAELHLSGHTLTTLGTDSGNLIIFGSEIQLMDQTHTNLFGTEVNGLRLKNFTTATLPTVPVAAFGSLVFDTDDDTLKLYVTDSDGSGTDGWVKILTSVSNDTTLDQAYENGAGTPSAPINSTVTVDSGDITWKLVSSSTYTDANFIVADRNDNSILNIYENDDGSGNLTESYFIVETKAYSGSPASKSISLTETADGSGVTGGGIILKTTSTNGAGPGDISLESQGDILIQGTQSSSDINITTSHSILISASTTASYISLRAGLNGISFEGTSGNIYGTQVYGIRVGNYSSHTSVIPPSGAFGSILFDTTVDRLYVYVNDSDGSGTDGWLKILTERDVSVPTMDDTYNNFGANPALVTIDKSEGQTTDLEFRLGSASDSFFISDSSGNSFAKFSHAAAGASYYGKVDLTNGILTLNNRSSAPTVNNHAGDIYYDTDYRSLMYYDSTDSHYYSACRLLLQYGSRSADGQYLHINNVRSGKSGIRIPHDATILSINAQAGGGNSTKTLQIRRNNSTTSLHTFSLSAGVYSNNSVGVNLAAGDYLQVFATASGSHVKNIVVTVEIAYRK